MGNRKRPGRWIGALPALVVAAVALFRLFDLDYGDLHSWDEAIHASWGRVVAERGEWLDLRAYPVWDFPSRRYPPLFVWSLGLLFRLFGPTESAARLFPALCGALTVLAAAWFGASWRGRRTGLAIALLVGGNYILVHFSRFAMTESTYLLFLFLAYAAYWRGLSDRRRRWTALAGLFFGLCFMTKGVVALLFPLGAAFHGLVGVALRRASGGEAGGFPPRRRVVTRLAAATATGLAIAAPWHVYMVVTQGSGFVYDYFLWNVVARVVSGVDMQSKALGPIYYLNQLPIRMPFASPLFLLGAVWFVAGVWRARRGESAPGAADRGEDLSTECLFFGWFIAALLVFSVAESKLVQYTPPILLPALVIAGRTAGRLWESDRWRGVGRIVLLAPIVWAWAAVTPARLACKRSIGALARARAPAGDDLAVTALFAAGAAAVVLLALVVSRPGRRAPHRLGPRPALAALAVILAGHALFRAFAYEPPRYRSGAKRVTEALIAGGWKHAVIVSLFVEPPFIFYLGVPPGEWQREHLAVVPTEELRAYLASAEKGRGRYVILDRSDYAEVDRWGRERFGGKLAAAEEELARVGVRRLETLRYELWELSGEAAGGRRG